MRLFVTGASGWIGSAASRLLVADGHTVVGLARSDSAAAVIEGLGGQVVRGTLDDVELLASQAAASDGVIHLAFRHDIAFTGDFDGAVSSDRAAIDAFGDALAGTGKPLLIASGTLGLLPGATEQDRPAEETSRVANASAALALADRGVRSVVVRFSPTVHGEGDTGFVTAMAAIAARTGVAGYVGDGTNQWNAIHRSDAAELVRRAVTAGPAGSVVHATAEDVRLRDIAEALGRAIGVPAGPIPADRAMEHFGFLGRFIDMDSPVSNAGTRATYGWEPTGPTLLEDIAAGHYTPAVAA